MPETESQTRKVDILNGGFVELIGHMVDLEHPESVTLDDQVAYAARVSYAEGTRTLRTSSQLIDYLMRHRHTSPFEMVTLKFRIRAPLFVVQQLLRHRTASINQESARYSEMQDHHYDPDLPRIQGQHATNKQGSGEELDREIKLEASRIFIESDFASYKRYERLLELGVSRELSRMVLTSNLFTTLIWEVDLHNLMHFLRLRLDEHAQWEIQQLAQALYDCVSPLVPESLRSFENHVLRAVTFSGDEMALIYDALETAYEHYEEDMKEPEFVEELDAELKKIGLSASRRREFFEKITKNRR